ncbi:sensor histidine kinase [Actinacidiphila paucisporea]|uniref:histidine kinase n=1 Tax=Actinacidiphila paucisporea TaxID=310782 RepID=A0A1M7H382_9ACTN|nr:HAMP domain-containing sensor histidine kinase [Actinacidiphila paucisporea]SHM23092.1 two-component system, OmpR family, sensor histidine kinase BaeS [Actinacidiphila paucisporea]
MRRRDAPARARLALRKSLLGRLLTVSALVALCSVAATAWLAVQTTSGAIRQEQSQSLSADAKIYNVLLGYAATHPGWDGVGGTVMELARQSQRRIALTTQDRHPLFDSAAGPSGGATADPLPAQSSAVIDPLSVDTALVPDADATGADRVDPRAVGPFLLPAKERAQLRRTAADSVDCLGRMGIAADIVQGASGRPRIRFVSDSTDAYQADRCRNTATDAPTATEKTALRGLGLLADACLKRQGRTGVTLKLNPDLSWDRGFGSPATGTKPSAVPASDDRAAAARKKAADQWPADAQSVKATADGRPGPLAEPVPAVRDSADDRAIASCVDSARREQLTAYVAAPALLFIDSPAAVSVPGFDLSPSNTARIAGATALVLLLTIGVSVIAGVRLVRPLHALTGAAQRMRDGLESAPVPVGADNEIGRLAATFNDMALHRSRLEEQRKVMVGDIAHELRTPLSNIRGWLEAAQDGLADPDPAFVASLLEEAVQLQHIIDDLRDLAAADAGALRLHPEPVRIDDLLGQVAAAHQARAEAAGVSLTVSPGEPGVPRPPLFDADPVRLRQAVSNLVSNAIRHTPPGGAVTLRAYVSGSVSGSVTASAGGAEETGRGDGGDGKEDRAGSGKEVVVEVADTGSGIPAQDVPYVFDRFWRAEKSRTRTTGGSGLGLAIVLKLAEAHGGTASVVSVAGQGSVFTVRLPAAANGPDAISMTS